MAGLACTVDKGQGSPHPMAVISGLTTQPTGITLIEYELQAKTFVLLLERPRVIESCRKVARLSLRGVQSHPGKSASCL